MSIKTFPDSHASFPFLDKTSEIGKNIVGEQPGFIAPGRCQRDRATPNLIEPPPLSMKRRKSFPDVDLPGKKD
jgi:hypothetical protein